MNCARKGIGWVIRGIAGLCALFAVAATVLCAHAPLSRAVELHVLAAGATEATIRDMVGQFEKQTGNSVKLTYGAVGALRDKIVAGEPVDVTIVTPAILEQLDAKGLIRKDTRTDVGRVGGGIAVRRGAPEPDVSTPEALKKALLAAEHVYYADPATATAGAYFMKVADGLGVGDEVRKKGRSAPGGKEAMKEMAADPGVAIGLTQMSEIVSVPEVKAIGPYPGKLQLSTTYSGVVVKNAKYPDAGMEFLKFLTSPAVQARFRKGGYE